VGGGGGGGGGTLYCSYYSNAIARLLRNTRPSPTPILYAIHHTILVVADRLQDTSFPDPVAELECVTLPWRLLQEA